MERPYRPLIDERFPRRLVRHLSYIVFSFVLWLIFVPIHGVRVKNRRRLRGPAISVMNHCIDIEWFFVWFGGWPHFIRFTAEEANMKRKDAAWFNYLLGVLGIPVDSPMAVAPAIRYALNRKELVHFFPEGIIHRRSQEPGEFMVGAAWFACVHDVPLIPIAEVLHGRWIHRFIPSWPPRVQMIVGEPMNPADFRLEGERTRSTARRMMDEAERFIREALKRESTGYGIQGEDRSA